MSRSPGSGKWPAIRMVNELREMRQKLAFNNSFSCKSSKASGKGSELARGRPREPRKVVTTANPKKSVERSGCNRAMPLGQAAGT